MDDTIKNIHVILKGTRIQKFNLIKSKLELNSDVDVMRMCLDIAHKQIIEDKIAIKPELLSVAENIVNTPYIRKRNLVFSVNDILNDSLSKWIQSHFSEYSLHSFSFRKDLSEDEQLLALVFVEHQDSFPRGMTLHNIMTFLPETELPAVEKILKNFVENQLVESTIIRNETYFFAPLI